MSVDYRAFFGIGARVHIESIEALSEHGEDVYEIMDRLIGDSSSYFRFEVGDSYEPNYIPEMYVCIKEPFRHGVRGLERKVKDLCAFLKFFNLTHDEVDCVGGLSVT